jgi:hypothetical protein
MVRLLRALLTVSVVDEYRGASSVLTGLRVPPSISDHVTGAEVNAQPIRSFEKKSRFWLSAVTPVAIVRTHTYSVQGQLSLQAIIDRGHDVFRHRSACDVRLIGHHDQQETCVSKYLTGLRDARKYLKVHRGHGRVRAPIANDSGIENAVSIEKHGPSLHAVGPGCSRKSRTIAAMD